MKTFITEVIAINPKNDYLETWAGPEIEAETIEQAQAWCDENGFGYCIVIGEKLFENEMHYN